VLSVAYEVRVGIFVCGRNFLAALLLFGSSTRVVREVVLVKGIHIEVTKANLLHELDGGLAAHGV